MARGRVVLPSDVVGGANTNWNAATGMSFSVVVGRKYHIKIMGLSTAAATTTGVVWGLAASPTTAPTIWSYVAIAASAAGTLQGGGQASMAYVTNGGANTGAYTPITDTVSTSGELTIVDGILIPSATQVLTVQFASEAAAATTAKAGSFVDYEEL